MTFAAQNIPGIIPNPFQNYSELLYIVIALVLLVTICSERTK